MILHDLHVHSVKSPCGWHTLLEIVEIAANKGMKTINLSDHGHASGNKMNFHALVNKKRIPRIIHSSRGVPITVLAGIEVNILDESGKNDLPPRLAPQFDLINAGLHNVAKELVEALNADLNTQALENYLKQTPLDILTHPCIIKFPYNLEKLTDLALAYGFALEVNNTAIRTDKNDMVQHEKMIRLALQKGVRLVENSDGHTFFEIGENEKVEALMHEMNLDGDTIFLNRDEQRLNAFLEERKSVRN